MLHYAMHCRPSVAHHRLSCCYTALQFVSDLLPADLNSVIRNALMKETSDVRITPTGTPALLFTELINKKSLVSKVATWFAVLLSIFNANFMHIFPVLFIQEYLP